MSVLQAWRTAFGLSVIVGLICGCGPRPEKPENKQEAPGAGANGVVAGHDAIQPGAALNSQPIAAGPRRAVRAGRDVPVPVAQAAQRLANSFLHFGDRIEGGPSTLRIRVADDGSLTLHPRSFGESTMPAFPGAAPIPAPMGGGIDATPATLATRSALRGDEPLEMLRGEPSVDGDGRVTIDRGFALEVIEPTEIGLEQRWRFDRAPAGEGTLSVEVALEGYEYVETNETGLHFKDPESGLGLRYGLAYWVDADDKRTEIVPEFLDGRVVIEVPADLVGEGPYPALLDPEISPEFEVDRTVFPNPSHETVSDVAFDGTNFMVVWTDTAALWSARFAPDGTLLDEVSRQLVSPGGGYYYPHLAFDGTNYVVAYMRYTGQYGIEGMRVSPEGELVAGPFAVTQRSSVPRYEPDVACENASCLVTWMEYNGSNYDIRAARLSATNAVLDPVPLPVATSTYYEYSPSVAFGDGHYLVSWYFWDGGTYRVGARSIDTSGGVGSYHSLNDTGALGYYPDVVWTGSSFVAAWYAYQSPGYALVGRRLEVDGTPIAAPFEILSSASPTIQPSLAWDGNRVNVEFWVSASVTNGLPVGRWVLKVTPDGDTVFGPRRLSPYSTTGRQGTACAPTGVCLNSWADSRTGNWDIYAGRTDRDGVPLDGLGVQLGHVLAFEDYPSAAFDGTNYMVTFMLRPPVGNAYEIRAARLSPSGQMLDSQAILVSSNDVSVLPRIAYGDGNYLITWYQRSGSGLYDVAFARVRANDGEVLDPGGQLIHPDPNTHQLRPDVAWDGSRFLVAYMEYKPSATRWYAINAVRIGNDGVPSSAPFTVEDPSSAAVDYPRLACIGADCVVVYRAPDGYISGRTVSPADVVGPLRRVSALAGANWPDIASSPDGYLVAWSRSNLIRGRLLDADGLPAADVVEISPIETYKSKYYPAVAFDGSGYFVAWQLYATDSGASDLYGTAVTTSGVSTDPGGIELSTLERDHYWPDLTAGNDGQLLLTYRRYDPDPPYNTYRVRARFIDEIGFDEDPPVFDPVADLVVEAQNPDGALVDYPIPTANDEVDGPILPHDVACHPPSGSLFALGTTTVRCSATDLAGNTAEVVFNVTVQDTTAPALQCQPVALVCTAELTQVDPTCVATDAVDPEPTVTSTIDEAGYPVGASTYTCSAEDAAGNSIVVTCPIDVENDVPVCEAPAGVTVECSQPGGVPSSDPDVQAFVSSATVVDQCGGATIASDIPGVLPASCAGAVTPVLFTASDQNGASSVCESLVTVVDTTPPELACPSPIELECRIHGGVSRDDQQVVDWLRAANGSDRCHQVTVSSDAPDLLALGANPATWTASDECGLSTSCTSVATVVDTTPPTANCTGETVECSGSLTPVSTSCSAADICDPEATSVSSAADSYALGSHDFTCTATDASGLRNVASCTVVVKDTTAPSTSCLDVVEECAGGLTPVSTSCSASDVCDGTLDPTSTARESYALGVHDFSCSATDASGNSNSDSCTVQIIDTTAPTPVCQGATAECAGELTPVSTSCSANDVCDGALDATSTAESSYALGTHEFSCSATDGSGNSATNSCSVTIVDTTAPTASCEGAVVECAGDLTPATTRCSASDVCDGTVEATSSAEASYALGSHEFSCSAADVSGNSDVASCTVDVVDTLAPVAACTDAVVECTGELTVAPTSCDAVDVCDPNLQATSDAPEGFPWGDSTYTCSASDGSGNVGAASCVVRVVDTTAPVVEPIVTVTDPVEADTPVTASALFQDACGAHIGAWDWGDGTTSEATVDDGAGEGVATGEHSYATPGVYTVTLTLQDSSGNQTTVTHQFIVVFDPSAGFVTGGGFIQSPEGAYPDDPGLTGKANFGFVAKYKKGQSTPSGETEFRFKAAGLDFHSDAYDWLVIAGPHAKYKGTGSLNGEAGYSFMLTATDGQVSGGGGTDTLRMKIWTGGGVVYDNQPGAGDDEDASQAIAGGSIVIHSK